MRICGNIDCNEQVKEKRKYCSFTCRNIQVNRTRDYSKNSKGLKKLTEKQKQEYNKNPNYCKHCNKKLPYKKRNLTYCDHSCRAKKVNTERKVKNRNYTDQGLENLRKANKREVRKRSNLYKQNPNKCVVCKEVLPYKKRTRSTCSNKCYRKLLSLKAHKRGFGGETNYKKFKYKGIWMDSNWEVETAKLLDKKKIKWERSKKHVFNYTGKKGGYRRYYPDFYLPEYDLYLDPKNPYKQQLDEYKIKQVIRENKIKVIVGDLKYILNFIENI